ncbi:MAG: DUF5110 domain-containing protein [Brevinematales bacterium]|nr:DUF5110 domain-containing protein [Brevinematales bacterium]
MEKAWSLVKRLTKTWLGEHIFQGNRKMIFLIFLGGVLIFSCEKALRQPPLGMVPVPEFWEQIPRQTPGEVVSLVENEQGWVLVCKRKTLVVCPLEQGWRVGWFSSSVSNFSRVSYAVVEEKGTTNGVSVSQTRESVIFTRGEEVLVVKKKDGRLFWSRAGKTLLSQKEVFRFEGERFTWGFDMPDSMAVCGLAEKAEGLNLRGKSFTFYNRDTYKYQRGHDPLYLAIPFAILWDKDVAWGVFLDNPAQSFWDIGARKNNSFSLGALEGEALLYLFSSSHVSGVIEAYTHLTGKPPLPPFWALGYQQSRFSYFPQARVMDIAKNFRERNLPADVLYLDIDFMEAKKSFTYDTNRFPDPSGLLHHLHEMDFRVVTIVNPGIAVRKGYAPYESGIREDVFVKLSNGRYAQGTVWPGICVFPDYSLPRTRVWWGRLYTHLLGMGFDGFWNDMNEPSVFNGRDGTLERTALHYDFGRFSFHSRVHNAYGLTMAQATYEGLTTLVPGKRHFVLSRAGYAGIQRYGFVWTGDNTASWDHLRLNLSMVLNLGLSGVPFAGADIGGYTGTPSEELFIRWIQLGVFLPFVRNHTEQGTAPQEPWAFGKRAEDIARRYLFVRYRLLPLWYTLAYEAHERGLPLVRPLFWEGGPVSEEGFLVGRDVVVYPILESGKTNIQGDLPLGSFVEWKSHTVFSRHFETSVTLEDIPLFIRRGSVLPLANISERLLKQGAPLSTILQVPDEHLRSTRDVRDITLWIFAGEKGEGSLYWDDGETTAYQQGGGLFAHYRWEEHATGATLRITVKGKPRGFSPLPIRWLVVEGLPEVDWVKRGDTSLPFERIGSRVVVSLSQENMWKESLLSLSYKGGKP